MTGLAETASRLRYERAISGTSIGKWVDREGEQERKIPRARVNRRCVREWRVCALRSKWDEKERVKRQQDPTLCRWCPLAWHWYRRHWRSRGGAANARIGLQNISPLFDQLAHLLKWREIQQSCWVALGLSPATRISVWPKRPRAATSWLVCTGPLQHFAPADTPARDHSSNPTLPLLFIVRTRPTPSPFPSYRPTGT